MVCAEPPQPQSQALPPTLLRLSPALGAWCWLPEELCAGKAPPPSWGCGERKRELKARGFHPLLASPDPAVALPARGRRKHPSARRAAPLPTPWGKGDAGGAGRLRVDVCVCVCAAQFCPGQGEKLQMRSAPCSVQAKMLAGFTPGSRVTPPAPAPGCVFTPLPYSRGK